jgi:hypothetical protein
VSTYRVVYRLPGNAVDYVRVVQADYLIAALDDLTREHPTCRVVSIATVE